MPLGLGFKGLRLTSPPRLNTKKAPNQQPLYRAATPPPLNTQTPTVPQARYDEAPLIQNQTNPSTPYTADPNQYSKLSTYLGYLLATNNTPQLNSMQVVGRYEAVLTQALYMCRLAYESDNLKIAAVNFINHVPVVFNTALRLINANNKFFIFDIYQKNLAQDKYPPVTLIEPSIGNGVIIQNNAKSTHCYMQLVDNTKNTGPTPLPGKKVLYISFRGSFQFINFTQVVLAAKLWTLKGLFEKCFMGYDDETESDPEKKRKKINVMDAMFKTEAEKNASMPHLKAHFGLISGLRRLLQEMLNQVQVFSNTYGNDIDQIIITGHSMGGAQACIAAMMLAAYKDQGNIVCLQKPSLHCITFGAPKFLSPTARNKFNSYLQKGLLTFDRVANRPESLLLGLSNLAPPYVDNIPFIFPTMQHPGYAILKTEFSPKGRFKNISDVRKNIGGLSNLKGGNNPIPRYPEFLQNFIQGNAENGLFTMEEYNSDLSNVFLGTIYKLTGKSDKEKQRHLQLYYAIRKLVEKTLPPSPETKNLKDLDEPPNKNALTSEKEAASNMEVPNLNEDEDGIRVDPQTLNLVVNSGPDPFAVIATDNAEDTLPPNQVNQVNADLLPLDQNNDMFNPDGTPVNPDDADAPPPRPPPYSSTNMNGGWPKFLTNAANYVKQKTVTNIQTSIDSSNQWRKESLKNSPNHVVYACERRVSPLWGHAGYMGVSFAGCLRNLIRAAANTDEFKDITVVSAVDGKQPATILLRESMKEVGMFDVLGNTAARVGQFFIPAAFNTGRKIGQNSTPTTLNPVTQGGRYTKKGRRKYNFIFTKRKPKQQQQPHQKKVTGKSRRYVKPKRRLTARRQ